MDIINNMLKWIKNLIANWKRRRAYQKRMRKVKKKDPFVYK